MNFQIEVKPNLDNKNNYKARFLLLYGSQTGQAQAISEEISERAPDFNLNADLHCLSKIDKKFNLEKESVAVFVVSTTGEGDPPETALKFWKRIKKVTLSNRHLSHLKYCLLGLGDSNYNNFAKFGKNLDKRLQQLGATKFMDSAFADDATGLDVTAEPWILKLWKALSKVLQIESNNILQTKETHNSDVVIKKLTDDDFQQKHNQALEFKSTDEQNMTATTLKNSATIPKDVQLNLPPLPKPVIKLQFEETNFESNISEEITREFPLAVSNTNYVKLKSAVKLTKEEAQKTVLELSLNIAGTDLSFQPGDSFGVICENDSEEVQLLIDRLDLSTVADLTVKVQPVDPGNKTKTSVPSHLPPSSSIRKILLTGCDIRAVPKKAFLRVLSEYTTDATEKRRLEELCSRQGSNEYNSLIREQSLSCLDLLIEFTSCKPSIERIVENLPPLQARPYSVANFMNSNEIRFAFAVVEFDKMKYHHTKRRGVCTSWLDKISRRIQIAEPSDEEVMPDGQTSNVLSVDSQKIAIFKRKSTGFHLPQDPSVPIIMICAGTGIAPFMGFLEFRHEQREAGIKSKHWLIFGCRNEENDFLYRKKIEHFRSSGTLDNFSLALSQSTTQKARYVQDVIKEEAGKFIQWITEMKAVIYVCGDVKNMMKDVRSQIEECFAEHKGMGIELAKNYVRELQDKKLYLQDVWL